MNMTLHADDGRALDLLLDRGPAAAADGPRFVPAGAGQDRVRSAEKVLSLLRWLPDTDPPHDLVFRTLSLIEQSADGRGARGGVHAAAEARHPLS